MHLSREFGYTVREIQNDGFKIDALVEMNPNEDTGFSMAESVGKGIMGMAKALKEINPDVVLVLGDRIESFAGAVAAAFMGIYIAHIHGGDNAEAGLDESMRHAITKFAHIHFPVTEKSAKRIKKLGEKEENIHVVGAPGLDTILNSKLFDKKDLENKLNIKLDDMVILMVQHSVSTEPEKAKSQIIETLEAIKELKIQTIMIYPNSDAGGREIIKQLKKYEYLPFIEVFESLPHLVYLSLMKYASVMIGNSSSGIIESASFKLPVVDIGTRQKERERSNNVIDNVDYNREEIIKAIKKALYDEDFKKKVKNCKNIYGNGKASEKIVEILGSVELTKDLLKKKLTY